ncbi:LacI family DNA-binding transcriptional regulator [Microbacterium sp.]|uniref:LacI family DNA-binding transcriptional regulator n=1 Tax=Microbacterium sp. TaxID=51671 RepID=UPI0033407DC9
MGKKGVTLKDVAAVAGVSTSIASRVLNGGGRVSPATREAILEAAQRLDFRPNALAQYFALGRSFTVGLLTENSTGIFSMPVIAGIANELSRHDVAAMVYDDGREGAARAENIKKLRARHVDGVIVVGDGNEVPLRSVTADFDVPVVYAHGITDTETDEVVLPDDRMAGRLAVEHLLAQGRRRIAHITAHRGADAVIRRLEGADAVLGEAGLVVDEAHREFGDWSGAWGYRAAERLHREDPSIDGIVCGNDLIALGAARYFAANGVRVPEDIALVGHDHWVKYSDAEARFLTTVDPRLVDVGVAATDLLVRMINAQPVEESVRRVPGELVLGYSSGALSAPEGQQIPFV